MAEELFLGFVAVGSSYREGTVDHGREKGNFMQAFLII